MAGGVHEAGRAMAGWAGSPVMDEVAGGYRLAGDLEPPSFPLPWGLRRLIGGEQVIPAERTVPILPGEQAERVAVRRPAPAGWSRTGQLQSRAGAGKEGQDVADGGFLAGGFW